MRCEICNKEGQLYLAEIEGSCINVCSGCAKFGKAIRRIEAAVKKENKKVLKANAAEEAEAEIIETIVEGCSGLIKKKREKLGLTQKELAMKIAERESLIQKIESGNIEPPIPLARKLEKFLGIKLVEKLKEAKANIQKGKSSVFTIGDFVKVRKRKP